MNVQAPRACVPHRVVDGLLGDPVERALDVDRLIGFIADHALGGDAVPCPKRLELLVEGGDQALRLEQVRPQSEDPRAHLSRAVLGEAHDVVDGPAAWSWSWSSHSRAIRAPRW